LFLNALDDDDMLEDINDQEHEENMMEAVHLLNMISRIASFRALSAVPSKFSKPVAVAVPVQTRLQSEQEARLALITFASTISAGEVRAVRVHADNREIEGDFGLAK
jgi:hypothetical protein